LKLTQWHKHSPRPFFLTSPTKSSSVSCHHCRREPNSINSPLCHLSSTTESPNSCAHALSCSLSPPASPRCFEATRFQIPPPPPPQLMVLLPHHSPVRAGILPPSSDSATSHLPLFPPVLQEPALVVADHHGSPSVIECCHPGTAPPPSHRPADEVLSSGCATQHRYFCREPHRLLATGGLTMNAPPRGLGAR
jgi:hypothetical protein